VSHHDYLFPTVLSLLPKEPCSVFEVGTGDGLFLKECARRGYYIEGLEIEPESINASSLYANCHARSILEDVSDLGRFDVVVSMEVVEHVPYPHKMAANIKSLLKPSGIAIITTPYHGYLKNLGLSIFNKWDTHLNPFWDGGHIKFWSRATLSRLFSEVGMREIGFYRVGRVPPLAKSMVSVYQVD